jgi:hypothetical protein
VSSSNGILFKAAADTQCDGERTAVDVSSSRTTPVRCFLPLVVLSRIGPATESKYYGSAVSGDTKVAAGVDSVSWSGSHDAVGLVLLVSLRSSSSSSSSSTSNSLLAISNNIAHIFLLSFSKLRFVM